MFSVAALCFCRVMSCSIVPVSLPDDGRIRPKHVVIFSSSINIVRNTCCVIDCTHIPIIHTHNGDGTFQNAKYINKKIR